MPVNDKRIVATRRTAARALPLACGELPQHVVFYNDDAKYDGLPGNRSTRTGRKLRLCQLATFALRSIFSFLDFPTASTTLFVASQLRHQQAADVFRDTFDKIQRRSADDNCEESLQRYFAGISAGACGMSRSSSRRRRLVTVEWV